VKLFDWDKELVKEQKKLIKSLNKLFVKLYKEYDEELKENQYLKENDENKVEKMSVDLFAEMLKVIGKAISR